MSLISNSRKPTNSVQNQKEKIEGLRYWKLELWKKLNKHITMPPFILGKILKFINRGPIVLVVVLSVVPLRAFEKTLHVLDFPIELIFFRLSFAFLPVILLALTTGGSRGTGLFFTPVERKEKFRKKNQGVATQKWRFPSVQKQWGKFKCLLSISKSSVSKDLGFLNPLWKWQIKMSSDSRDIEFWSWRPRNHGGG